MAHVRQNAVAQPAVYNRKNERPEGAESAGFAGRDETGQYPTLDLADQKHWRHEGPQEQGSHLTARNVQ